MKRVLTTILLCTALGTIYTILFVPIFKSFRTDKGTLSLIMLLSYLGIALFSYFGCAPSEETFVSEEEFKEGEKEYEL